MTSTASAPSTSMAVSTLVAILVSSEVEEVLLGGPRRIAARRPMDGLRDLDVAFESKADYVDFVRRLAGRAGSQSWEAIVSAGSARLRLPVGPLRDLTILIDPDGLPIVRLRNSTPVTSTR